MGLDMYLTRETYFMRYGDMQFDLDFGYNTDPEKVMSITEEVGYWRKCNQIHFWFVENVQDGNDDCGRYNVDISQLEELLDAVNMVLKDPSKSEHLLPTQAGFFFGSTEYDDYYIDDLVYTKNMLEEIIAKENSLPDLDQIWVSFYYSSSW